MARLKEALEERQSPLEFVISGINCMAGCSRPCKIAYQADGKATYLFGDIDPDGSVAALVAFADQYASLDDGWCSATERPKALLNKTLARIPALGSLSSPALESPNTSSQGGKP